jgi:hypothetical protein
MVRFRRWVRPKKGVLLADVLPGNLSDRDLGTAAAPGGPQTITSPRDLGDDID